MKSVIAGSALADAFSRISRRKPGSITRAARNASAEADPTRAFSVFVGSAPRTVFRGLQAAVRSADPTRSATADSRIGRPASVTILIVLLALIQSPAFAHNSSVTPIDVKVERQSVAVTLSLNQADLLEHVLNAAHGPGRFADRQEYEDAAPALLSYVIAR